MSRIRVMFAVLALAAIVCVVPQAFASNPTMEVVMSGSSAFWQTAAVGAYNNGHSLVPPTTNLTCHWTSGSNKIALVDSRPGSIGGTNNTDNGTLWVVWDIATTGGATCATSPAPAALHVWADLKVDSVVGVRCFFAVPRCTIVGTSNGSSGTLDGNANDKIKFPGTPWGTTDSFLPANVLSVFTGGAGTLNRVGAAATDIRAEDAAFAACRVNSPLGAGSVNTGDALDGLGYSQAGASQTSGECAVTGGSNAQTLLNTVGQPIQSGVQLTSGATGATANPIAFNLTGTDPISGTTVPAYKEINVGGEPIIFVASHKNHLASLRNVSKEQLEAVFSGTNCDASAFGLAAGGINIFLREPLSGTMNTTEATVFRRPTVNINSPLTGAPALGISQETNVGSHNPLAGNAGTCAAGAGARYRGIGTGEVIDDGVCASNNDNASNCGVTGNYTAQDGIAYTFFSYGNISKESNQQEYNYLTIDQIDPIWTSYGNQPTQPSGFTCANAALTTPCPFDPGQAPDAGGVAGILPGAANLPSTCEGGAGHFPCSEDLLWSLNNAIESTTHTPLSFPNVRLGKYPAWNILRVISDKTGGQSAAAGTLVTNSNKYAVGYVPDYIPIGLVAAQTVVSHSVPADPGLPVLRSHYLQRDGSGNLLPATGCTTAVNTGTGECGGDMGGSVLNNTTTNSQNSVIQHVQGPSGFQLRPN